MCNGFGGLMVTPAALAEYVQVTPAARAEMIAKLALIEGYVPEAS